MPRLFTRDQAERLLPAVERAMREAKDHRSEYQQTEAELERALRRLNMLGGAQVNGDAILSLRARKDSSAAGLKDAIERIHEMGAQVKDLDLGLVDFLTRYRGREVLLCWKLGEPAILYWHGLEEGYRGRKQIDDDFLAHHQGDSAN